MATYEKQRRDMVERQIAPRGITDERLLNAMREVPRERFVSEEKRAHAYDDGPLPIGEGQTISQPYVVALMISALKIRPDDRVLEVGAGSGYAAAIMGKLAKEVHAIERHASLAKFANERMEELGYTNVHVHHADGTLGWHDRAPYDAIIVSAGGTSVPDALREQSRVGGRLVIPVGEAGGSQVLRFIRRTGEDSYEELTFGRVQFVPLVGADE